MIEYSIPARDGDDQRVTLMAPSVVGLPTPGDEDLLLALLYLAKEQGFAEDTVRFSTTDLCEAMHRSVNQEARNRIEEGLMRLKALTLKYELAWYDKLKAEVEPILITGILAEAKFMRRRGRPKAGEPKDSYVQWTKNFYKTISSGNLTDIDLSLYFSFSRPTSRQLYRHLNKRFYGRREHERYERDLVQLACGHLGMKKSKYLKRNLDQCVHELEQRGYIVAEAPGQRYRKVRPGVWRVGFTLDPQHRKGGRSGGVIPNSAIARDCNSADNLVRSFHSHWSGGGDYRPTKGELAIADRLIEEHGFDVLHDSLPQFVKVLRQKWPDCKTFKGIEVYIEDGLARVHETQRRQEQRKREEQERIDEQKKKDESRKREAELSEVWEELSDAEREGIRTVALKGHPANMMERHPKLARSICLAELAKQQKRKRET